MAKFFVGNHLKLRGITRHGKNRIRENGDMWEILAVDGQNSSILATKVSLMPLSGTGNWRWIDVPEDSDMEIVEHIE
jgi:hypothetical protein